MSDTSKTIDAFDNPEAGKHMRVLRSPMRSMPNADRPAQAEIDAALKWFAQALAGAGAMSNERDLKTTA